MEGLGIQLCNRYELCPTACWLVLCAERMNEVSFLNKVLDGILHSSLSTSNVRCPARKSSTQHGEDTTNTVLYLMLTIAEKTSLLVGSTTGSLTVEYHRSTRMKHTHNQQQHQEVLHHTHIRDKARLRSLNLFPSPRSDINPALP